VTSHVCRSEFVIEREEGEVQTRSAALQKKSLSGSLSKKGEKRDAERKAEKGRTLLAEGKTGLLKSSRNRKSDRKLETTGEGVYRKDSLRYYKKRPWRPNEGSMGGGQRRAAQVLGEAPRQGERIIKGGLSKSTQNTHFTTGRVFAGGAKKGLSMEDGSLEGSRWNPDPWEGEGQLKDTLG